MKRKFTFLLFLAITFSALNVAAQFPSTYYVSAANGNDANGGLFANNALRTLREAVKRMRQNPAPEITILIEKGTYYPYDETGPANPHASFLLSRNELNQSGKTLRILGGYDFTNSTRDIARNPTILHGNDAVNHVVVIGNVSTSADSLVIEGLTIGQSNFSTEDSLVQYTPNLFVLTQLGGGIVLQNCNNNKIVFRRCIITGNVSYQGGGLFALYSDGAVFENCVFENNITFTQDGVIGWGVGGGAKIEYSSIKFSGCTFYNNMANLGSAILELNKDNETVTITNCTFAHNDYWERGQPNLPQPFTPVIYKQTTGGRIELNNSIFWGNRSGREKSGLNLHGGGIYMSNVASENDWDNDFATGPFFLLDRLTDPFVNFSRPKGPDGLWMTADDGLRLDSCRTDHPAMNSGNNSYAAGLTTDLSSRLRIRESTIDLGAYETQTISRKYWIDNDGDGYGAEGTQPITVRCQPPAGYVNRPQDCDDGDNTVYQGAPEICDGKDNDCNGRVDDIHNAPRYFPDADGDGHGDKSFNGEVHCPLPGYVTSSDDCNDNDNTAWENAPELCDGKDNNCDGHIDDHIILRYYLDNDHDGYGGGGSIESCAPVAGRVTQDGDCDDNDNTIYPGAPELCDGKNNNCNAYIDDGQQVKQYLDNDHDGYGNPNFSIMSCPAVAGRILRGGDCDDNDNTIYPGAGGCAALPLTLVDFTIKEQGQKAVALWTTTDEVNTHHFDLEKSADGNQFLKIATLPAMNAPGDHNYSYIDPQPFAGKNYYRIKMVDLDGTYTYSRIASLHGNDTRAVSAIYPNPASDIVNVVIEESNNDLSVQLISIDGKLIQTKRLAVRGTYQLNVTKLPAGIYFIKVSNGETYKLIKQ